MVRYRTFRVRLLKNKNCKYSSVRLVSGVGTPTFPDKHLTLKQSAVAILIIVGQKVRAYRTVCVQLLILYLHIWYVQSIIVGYFLIADRTIAKLATAVRKSSYHHGVHSAAQTNVGKTQRESHHVQNNSVKRNQTYSEFRSGHRKTPTRERYAS